MHCLHCFTPTDSDCKTTTGNCVGVLGELHPKVCTALKIKRVRPIFMELEESALSNTGARKGYRPPPTHKDLTRTICFALPAGVEAATVASTLSENGARIQVVDEFRFNEADTELRAITYELHYPNPTGQLSADEVNQRLQELILLVQERFAESGVRHRYDCLAGIKNQHLDKSVFCQLLRASSLRSK